jgi:hypothetical protein
MIGGFYKVGEIRGRVINGTDLPIFRQGQHEVFSDKSRCTSDNDLQTCAPKLLNIYYGVNEEYVINKIFLLG